MNLRSLRIAPRAALCFGAVTLFVMLLGVFALFQLNALRATEQAMEAEWLASVQTTDDIQIALLHTRLESIRLLASEDSAAMAIATRQIQMNRDVMNARTAYYREHLVSTPEERTNFEQAALQMKAYLEGLEHVVALVGTDRNEALKLANGDQRLRAEGYQERLTALREFNSEGARQASQAALGIYEHSVRITVGIMLLAVVVTLLLAWRLVPADIPTQRHPLDWRGFLLLGGACVTFMWGVERLGQNQGSLGSNLAWMGIGLILGVKAVRHTARLDRPLIDFSTLRIPTYRASILGGGLFRVSIATAPFLLPLMFQLSFGLDAFQSGLLLLALFAGNLAAKPFTTAAMRRFGLRRILTVNGLLSALSLLACGLLTPAWPLPLVLLLLFASGVFRSLQFTASNALAFADIPKARLSHASTLFSTNFQLAMGLGVAIAALLLRASMEWHGHLDPQLLDFRLAFIAIAVLGVLSTLDSFRLARDAGDAVSGHRLP